MLTTEEVQAGARDIGWYHSIDLGHGIVTQGASKDVTIPSTRLPEFSGRSVLDIGAWDGYYSFMAERLGATRVVSLDHYAWGVDIVAREKYWSECRARGVLPDHGRDVTDFFDASLPGRRGFDFAKVALDSAAEPVLGDFTTIDLAPLGTFDVVLYLGVLYHMRDPLGCLDRVRSVTREVAAIETVCVYNPAFPSHSLLEFFPGGELNSDYGNWFVPTVEAVRDMALAAGFARAEIVQGPATAGRRSVRARVKDRIRPGSSIGYFRGLVHAYT